VSLVSELKLGEVDTVRCMLLEGRYDSLEGQDDRQDGTALTWAACLGLEDVVEILLTLGARTDTQTAWGSTPLHVACDYGNFSIVKILLSCGADVNAVTSSGDTACHLAAYRGFTSIVRLLLENGANPHLKNNQRKNVFHETQASGKKELITLMKSYAKSSKNNNQSRKSTECGNINPDVVQVSRIDEHYVENGHRHCAPPSGCDEKRQGQNQSCISTRCRQSGKSQTGKPSEHVDSISVYKTKDYQTKMSAVEDNLDSFVSSKSSKSFYKPKILPS
jgi:hypothetical protein